MGRDRSFSGGEDMKIGTIVRDKETDKLGFICDTHRYMNWCWVYWLDESRKEEVVNFTLMVIV